ncbi:Ca -dependent secretion activator, partial [Cichlidogyrus casuarinus]
MKRKHFRTRKSALTFKYVPDMYNFDEKEDRIRIAKSAKLFVTEQGMQDANVRTVLVEERDMFLHVRQRLNVLLERQIVEFRYYFPFGRPEGALKQTLGLLERVLMRDNGHPASAEEVRQVIRQCLEKAAHVNYQRISEYAMIESGNNKSLPDIIHLAELCIEVLRQNEEHHAE